MENKDVALKDDLDMIKVVNPWGIILKLIKPIKLEFQSKKGQWCPDTGKKVARRNTTSTQQVAAWWKAYFLPAL